MFSKRSLKKNFKQLMKILLVRFYWC